VVAWIEPGVPAATFHSCARYLARMGASHLAATHDFAGGPARDLHAYVTSAIFPQAADPARRATFRAALRAITNAARQ